MFHKIILKKIVRFLIIESGYSLASTFVESLAELGIVSYKDNLYIKEPDKCTLWNGEPQNCDLNYKNFSLIRTFEEDSHYSERLLIHKECGQVYLKIFTEEVDWINGDDPQQSIYFPVSVGNDSNLQKLDYSSLTASYISNIKLVSDFPKDAAKSEIYWLGK